MELEGTENALNFLEPTEIEKKRVVVNRPTWSGQLEFILATVGYAVGLGNVWRFPYLCYSNGGGAFMIPYLVMVVVCGIPLVLMEFTIGQCFSTLADVKVTFTGAGLSTVVISFIFSTYHNVVLCWSLFYMFTSFGATLPWMSCNNTWNLVENCSSGFLSSNNTELQSASQQFFDHRVLEKTSGIEEPGGLRWELFGCLLHSNISLLHLLALLINNVQLPGASDGILYFVTPVWNKLFEVKVWFNAAAQVFMSLGIAFGSMISMSSYNKFNNNILRDALIVSITNSFTSILAGFVIFSALGYMAHMYELPIDNIATAGPGLVFVVYPEALSAMPISRLWAPLFFIMLLCLGLDSQFANVEVVITCIKDELGSKVSGLLKREALLSLIVCTVGFILGIPHVTKGGIYVFQLMDTYTAVLSVVFLAFCEVVAVCWIFGVRKISLMMKRMLDNMPSIYFRFCWILLCPLLILSILVSGIVHYSPAHYGSYTYPVWADCVGWFISLASIVWIPLGAIHEMYKNKGSVLQRLRKAVTPTVDLAKEG
ncbi:Sodium- and chloride-dependent GABA transporter ine [Takifugu flavidus]|uniref:Transporter n=1 Tax=Takifugu flavidus TaxID=433684 RepID=A0A5C6MZ25_9TELE|nr:Sodium- and chloride-dependent GABA transporter ine [Takifugu flavidus]